MARKKKNITGALIGHHNYARSESQNTRTGGGDVPKPGIPPAAGWQCATSTRSGRLSHPASRSPELPPTSGLAARGRNRRSVRPRAGTPRAGTKQQQRLSVLEPWRHRWSGIYIEMLVCSLFSLRAPVVLSALGGSCTVECTQVSLSQLCFSGHAITEFVFCFGFQAMHDLVASRSQRRTHLYISRQ